MMLIKVDDKKQCEKVLHRKEGGGKKLGELTNQTNLETNSTSGQTLLILKF